MDEFNREFGHKLVWLPWQRPGFELGLMLRQAVATTPAATASSSAATASSPGATPSASATSTPSPSSTRSASSSSATAAPKAPSASAARPSPPAKTRKTRHQIAPYLRGRVSSKPLDRQLLRRSRRPQFVNSATPKSSAFLGTSCPDHFIRTKIRPLFIPWPANADLAALKTQIASRSTSTASSTRLLPLLRHARFARPPRPSPTVVLIQGLGMFSFGKNKTEARITGEFYTNAIHVMEGASLLGEGEVRSNRHLPQCGPAGSRQLQVFTNYVALPAIEAFRIEYWAMEEAKIRRQPPEKELSRRIAARRRRRQRHRPRSRSAGRRPRRPRRRRRPRRSRRRPRRRELS
jgi:rhamnose utilization protein RhaD (predicted bifunctional aldolase and dehydrogenase)